MLIVEELDVNYGGLEILKNINLKIEKREIVALIGANGAGKTTLLNTISGFVKPKNGKIYFEGLDITRLLPHEIVEIGIAHVPEGRRIFPELTVIDNLILGAFPRRARRFVDENLKFVFFLFPRLEERKKQIAKTLSGGEQQMLSIGRGLMSAPKILLLDEISLGLAPVIINSLYKALKIIREKGIAILFVEQNVRKSLEEADRAYILEGGKIVLSDSCHNLKNHHKVKELYFGV
uniref:ABC transporter ATP-binding protein n=1 Tax=candidate division WOR-3 bacterium TaxID=2052148 RepID=A0A7C2K0R9_UNCW3